MFDYEFDHEAVLQELGLGNVDPAIKLQAIEGIYKQLSLRVRLRIEEMMSDEDFRTFAELADKDDAQAKKWLEARFPNYEQLYDEELSGLVSAINRHNDAVIETAKKIRQS